MLVGKGLIASQFKHYTDNDDVVVFASGVSNSKETKRDEFDQEIKLIESYIPQKKIFVYFSTCSIFDDSLTDSNYVKHKLKIEKLIQSRFERFLILRLPNMIGLTNNPNTFFNYFFEAILNGKSLIIQKYAIRYFMDVEDLPFILDIILKDEESMNTIINVSYNNPINIPEILTFFEEEMGKKAMVSFVEKGSNYAVPNDYFNDLFSRKKGHAIVEAYTKNCIKKYIKLKSAGSH
ncbi:MAG: NAD-dependent epimerase [Bacteroidota bacterium]